MKKQIIFTVFISAIVFFSLGLMLENKIHLTQLFRHEDLADSPFVEKFSSKKLPLLRYTIDNLQNFPFESSSIQVKKVIAEYDGYTSYLFSYQTLGKKMTGQLNIPKTASSATGYPVVILIRGWVPAESYTTGIGTKSAAAVFAQHGYVTLAPDFFGMGESDPEVDDPWTARFQKPINVVELIKTVQDTTQLNVLGNQKRINSSAKDLRLWAHSNGGQIALTTLEILDKPIKTTLWAPVSAPFPYSILFFSDENEDEGKATRKWVSLFEDKYDVFDFSLTQHLDLLQGSLQIHQGTNDDAVPVAWNDEFVEKLKLENKRREKLRQKLKNATASESAKLIEMGVDPQKLAPIKIQYHRYPGANHNLQPNWNQVIQRDLEFFSAQ